MKDVSTILLSWTIFVVISAAWITYWTLPIVFVGPFFGLIQLDRAEVWLSPGSIAVWSLTGAVSFLPAWIKYRVNVKRGMTIRGAILDTVVAAAIVSLELTLLAAAFLLHW